MGEDSHCNDYMYTKHLFYGVIDIRQTLFLQAKHSLGIDKAPAKSQQRKTQLEVLCIMAAIMGERWHWYALCKCRVKSEQ